jgi:hypothetical protein
MGHNGMWRAVFSGGGGPLFDLLGAPVQRGQESAV